VRFIAHAHQIVQRVLQGLDGHAWAGITDAHAIGLHGDLDVRGKASVLTGIEGVINQLLQQSHRPLLFSEADLHLEFFLAEKLQQSARVKGSAFERLLHRVPSMKYIG
jgi:hypothetical protein